MPFGFAPAASRVSRTAKNMKSNASSFIPVTLSWKQLLSQHSSVMWCSSDLIRNHLLSSNGCIRKTESFIFRGAHCLHYNIRLFLCLCIAVYLSKKEDCFALVVQVASWRETHRFRVWSFWYNKSLCNDCVMLFCIHKIRWFILFPCSVLDLGGWINLYLPNMTEH